MGGFSFRRRHRQVDETETEGLSEVTPVRNLGGQALHPLRVEPTECDDVQWILRMGSNVTKPPLPQSCRDNVIPPAVTLRQVCVRVLGTTYRA